MLEEFSNKSRENSVTSWITKVSLDWLQEITKQFMDHQPEIGA